MKLAPQGAGYDDFRNINRFGPKLQQKDIDDCLNYSTIFASNGQSANVSIDSKKESSLEKKSVTERFNIVTKPKTSQPGNRVNIPKVELEDEFEVTNHLYNTERQDMFSETIHETEEYSPVIDSRAPTQNEKGISLNLTGLYKNAMVKKKGGATEPSTSAKCSDRLVS